MSKRTITGVVTSTAMDKTIVVTRTTRETHPLYGKKFTTSAKFHAHDAKNAAHVGDTVVIEESVPFSRTVKWNLVKIVEAGREKLDIKQTEVEQEMGAKHEKTEEDEK